MNGYLDSPEYNIWKDRVYKEHIKGKCGCMCADSTSIPNCVPKMDVMAPEFKAYVSRVYLKQS